MKKYGKTRIDISVPHDVKVIQGNQNIENQKKLCAKKKMRVRFTQKKSKISDQLFSDCLKFGQRFR